MLRLVRRFNRLNPDVRVTMQRIDWGTYYNKLYVAGLGGRAPEVFVLQSHAIDRFAEAKFIRPIDDLVSGSTGIDTADFDRNVWRTVDIDGRHYGIPLDIWVMGMYYNRSLLQRAGVTDAGGTASPPRTRQEFLAALRQVARRDQTPGQPSNWGFAFTNYQSNVFTVMRQYGGRLISKDGASCTMNSPENVAALRFCVDLIRRDHLVPPPENVDPWIGFRQGRAAMVFEGIYMLSDLKKQTDLDFGGAPVPELGARKAVWAGSHVLCLRADLPAETRNAAWRFVQFLSDNSLDWAAGGQVPARRSLRNTARFRAMTVQYQFARQIPYAVYMPEVPYTFELQTEFGDAVERALRGVQTPQQALDQGAANVDRAIARWRAEAQQAAAGS